MLLMAVVVAVADEATGATVVVPFLAVVVTGAWLWANRAGDRLEVAFAILAVLLLGNVLQNLLAMFDQTIVPSLLDHVTGDDRTRVVDVAEKLRRHAHYGAIVALATTAILWSSLARRIAGSWFATAGASLGVSLLVREILSRH